MLPGALTAREFQSQILRGEDLITNAPTGYWRISPELLKGREQLAGSRGGYVQGFEKVFHPDAFGIPAEEILKLEPLHHWILHSVGEALSSAGVSTRPGPRGGLILGNLSYPSEGLARFAESIWLERPGMDPRARFMSGFPVMHAARIHGLEGDSFAVDAACASSLYAFKLACDRLQSGAMDLMVAGGVNRADNLFLHMGFTALGAISLSGQSRPFHRDADGLLPAEGIACFALRRLEDAVAHSEPILGVIRGIGLSNDGRHGFLAPSEEGQFRAMEKAYRTSGIDPGEISLIECHATGTLAGDAVEIRSMSRLFQGLRDVPIGSVKSNTGHLLAAAGAAGLLKVLGAFQAGTKPPTLHAKRPIEAIQDSPFRLLAEAEPWVSDGPRRAAVSAFGFGGNNAHLIIEEWKGNKQIASLSRKKQAPSPAIAIVGIGTCVSDAKGTREFEEALFSGERRLNSAGPVEFSLNELRFPPKDVAEALPQQLLILRAANDAIAEVENLPADRTSVLIGMQCDAEVARYGVRWRLADLVGAHTGPARDEFQPALNPAGVIGTMPNIVANRINSQHDFRAPGFVISAEELSGLEALRIAAEALQNTEVDAAIIGAVDLCREPVHEAACRQIFGNTFSEAGDAAVALVLKRLDDAQRDGNHIYACLHVGDSAGTAKAQPAEALAFPEITSQFGHSHSASALVHVAAAALACSRKALPGGVDKRAVPWVSGSVPRAFKVSMESFAGQNGTVLVSENVDSPPRSSGAFPVIHCYSGANTAEVLQAIREGRESTNGITRLVLVAMNDVELRNQRETALRVLAQNPSATFPSESGIFFRQKPIEGETAFVYSFSAASYPGMGRDLLLAMPALLDFEISKRFSNSASFLRELFSPAASIPDSLAELKSYSFLCHLHTRLSRDIFQLKPNAAIGISTGESSALFCLGAWNNPEQMFEEIDRSGLYSCELDGEFRCVREAWRRKGHEISSRVDWANWRIYLSVDQVRAVVSREKLVHLTLVHSPEDCMIGGQAEACERVIERLGRKHAQKILRGMAVHCPEVEPFAEQWRTLHRRVTTPVPNVRFYSNATASYYPLGADAAADALTTQALQTVDFPKTILNAWHDGVRIFVEHGPGGYCGEWIRRVLEDREHIVVSLDRAGRSSAKQACFAAAELLAAGVPVNLSWLLKREHCDPAAIPKQPALSFVTHRPLVQLTSPTPADSGARVWRMEPAPWLPPVLNVPSGEVKPKRNADPAPPAPGPVPEAPNGWVALQRRHSALQQEWIRSQSELHRQFLDMRERALSQALRISAGVLSASAPEVFSAPPKPMPLPLSGSRPGPKLTRADLEIISSGKISSVFGDLFVQQDGYARQVRMPTPPLLLADRVLGIAGEPGSMGLGTIWTETDVTPKAWYLHDGFMPAGIMIEAGQADLLLVSWLGVDFENRGERVYRLLGCELTYSGSLPRPGETLSYEIHVDGYARQDDIRLFFFHYDCHVNGKLRLKVRHGQAGFFSAEELANSMGVLWDAATTDIPQAGRCDAPSIRCHGHQFTADQVRAFANGRLLDCFGRGFEMALTHTRTPRIPSGKMLLFDAVQSFNPSGGPWGRGYLKATLAIHPDHWFFEGHFKNDPCMPGTLMFEGCLQTMAFYLSGLGYSIDRDGWRFEPVPDVPYKLSCRGQVLPSSRELVYEVFVREVHDGPIPTLYADLLCTVDGLKAFHCERMGYCLVPDWPMSSRPELIETIREKKPVARVNGFDFGYASLLACAWGKPSDAFGEMYRIFDGTRRVARLPGPPYHFMSRVVEVNGEIGEPKPGATVVIEYDVPEQSWYFADNGYPTMPFAVLLEAVLQPCGWLASYVGCAVKSPEDLSFRNLDGSGTVYRKVLPAGSTLTTSVKLTSLSKSAGIVILSFDVTCVCGSEKVYELKTVFGFFPKEALANQIGLPASDADREWLAKPSDFVVDLAKASAQPEGVVPRIARPILRMIDRVTGFWPEAGHAGLGRLRAEKDVDPDEWFFKAHFFQDPVQPGSLGIEAMLQLLQFYMIERGCAKGIQQPRFEPIALGDAHSWKYRGQVVPTNKRITTEIEVLRIIGDEHGVAVFADAWLWVDDKKIYQASIGMRIAPGEKPSVRETTDEILVDAESSPWILDHRPTYTLPALPLMSILDFVAAHAQNNCPAKKVVRIENFQVHRWALVNPAAQLRISSLQIDSSDDDEIGYEVTAELWREAARAELSRFEPLATARVFLRGDYAEPSGSFPVLAGTLENKNPYANGELFHGPSFQILKSLRSSHSGSSSRLDAAMDKVPLGLLNPALLDGATHGIPHDQLEKWSDKITPGQVAYPVRITSMTIHGATPDRGEVRCEARFDGFDGGPRFPAFHIQLLCGDAVWIEFRLVEALFPKGPIGSAPALNRRAFLRDQIPVRGLGLSRFEEGNTRLTPEEFSGSDWFPGTIASVYSLRTDRPVEETAVKDHIACETGAHPSTVQYHPEQNVATCLAWPLNRFPLQIVRSADGAVQISNAGPSTVELDMALPVLRRLLGRTKPEIERLYTALARAFVSRVEFTNVPAMEKLRGRSVLYLANHQCQIESILFSMLVSGIQELPVVVLANAKHRDRWVGQLVRRTFDGADARDPELIRYFNQDQPELLNGIIDEIGQKMKAGHRSLMVHVEGTRQRSCRDEVGKVSSIFPDLALRIGVPIVPVRFMRGLPIEPLTNGKLEFPVGYCGQEYRFGTPIFPEELQPLSLAGRRDRILNAIRELGSTTTENPNPMRADFTAKVQKMMREESVSEVDAVLATLLNS